MTSDLQLRDGRYAVRGVLGEGAQGTTYEAEDLRDGRAVAIKRFDVRGARSWKDVELAEREARVLSTLDHPLVPRYIEHFEENGSLYLVMEKVEGETLDAILRREGPLPEQEVRRFLADADRALTYLHGRSSPIVHRDIKPRNVVRRSNGSYVLVDFGAVSELVMRRAGASTVVGTMGYMAPEQLQGRAQPATDVYGVGATALAALTGAEPETLPHRGLHIDVRSALEDRASPALIESIEHMVEPDPERRATSLAAALDGVHSEASLSPPAPPPMQAGTAPVDTASEDALVKSVRKLLWVLWGLAWIAVPVSLDHLGAKHLTPLVMFGSLPVLVILSWHKGVLIRAVLRAFMQQRAADDARAAPQIASPPRRRIDVGPERQIRIHTTDLQPDEVTGETELGTTEAEPRRMAHRR